MSKASEVFQRFFLPGLIFQSVLVGGGYATGRELVEFFLSSGPWGGLLGMIVTTALWSVVLAISFEFARTTKSYDYRAFFRKLLGRGWFLFEIAFIALALLVLSVLGSATGELIRESLGVPALFGIVAMMGVSGLLAFYGSKTIERFLAGWSFVLYAAYILYFILWMGSFGDRIISNFGSVPVGGSGLGGGIQYAGYNMVGMIAVLFCLRHLKTRKEAVVAGVLAGPLAIIPGFLFYIAMVGFYPEITQKPVPVNFMLGQLNIPSLQILFQLVLFGTFIETGVGMIHAVNERIAEVFTEKQKAMPRFLRPSVAVGMLIFSIFLATKLGIISLIGQGYGALTYVILAIYVFPMLTIGLWRIIRPDSQSERIA
ncbi:MAG: hypothetical protein R2747_07340 [Pyrinomonadaceae bacterium]